MWSIHGCMTFPRAVVQWGAITIITVNSPVLGKTAKARTPHAEHSHFLL